MLLLALLRGQLVLQAMGQQQQVDTWGHQQAAAAVQVVAMLLLLNG
jgi:hypothetical protein